MPGNHDAALVRSWARAQGASLAIDAPVPLDATPLLARGTSWLAPAPVRVHYPGVWLSERVWATHGHYLGTELAKEAPYYAGAFGAAVLSDSVSSTDAIVFLAGTNLGAAGYEYALARITRLVLRRRSPQACASFDTDPVPRAYLAEHYSRVEPDETRTSNASNRPTSLGRHDQDDDRRR